MSRELRLVLEDISAACRRLAGWSAGLREEDLLLDRIEYPAILRELTVIGEAVKSLPVDFTASRPQVPWRGFAGLRDIIIHRYFGVIEHVVWEAVSFEVPLLLDAVDLALAEIEDQQTR